jgi:hypothetical protein
VLLAVLIPYASMFMSVPMFDATSALVSVVTSVPAVVLASLASARLGKWLSNVRRARTTVADDVRPPDVSPGARTRELIAR